MKLSSNNNAVLGLLSVLLAFPTTETAAKDATGSAEAGITTSKGARQVEVAPRMLVDCTDEDFLVTEFVVVEAGGSNSTEETYEGCYEVADTLDDDLELSLFKIDGDLEAGGGAFYASDNNGGYEEPVWFFAVVDEETATQNVSDSFLCFDLDLNAAADTSPADVTNWGLVIDGSSSTSRVCEITMSCGCSVDDDDEEDEATDDDADAAVDGANAAFSVTSSSSGSRFVLIAASVFLAVVNGARP